MAESAEIDEDADEASEDGSEGAEGALDEDENDEDDDDDESEEEDEDDDEELGAVDPAFRARVAAALQVSGMDVEQGGEDGEEEDESDEEVWDDEQMMKVDEQLAAVFRDRAGSDKKTTKSESHRRQNESSGMLISYADLQTESTHFKARILDLYEVFAKKQPTNPLVIELVLPLLNIIKNSGNAAAALSNKASSLIRSRFNKPKDLPTTVDLTSAAEVLTRIHDMARKTYSGEFTSLCSICSIFVARAMEASSSSTASSATACQEVVDVYAKTLQEYMTHKQTQLHATFLADYFKRHALRAWPLHTTLVPLLYPGKTVNIYRQNIGYDLLSYLSPQLPTINKSHSKQVSKMIPQVIDAVYATLTVAQTDEGWKADRVKDLLKPVLAFARSTKIVGYEWDLERLDAVMESTKSGRLAKFGSVTSLLAQLRALVAKEAGQGKAKASNGTAKAGKKRSADVAREALEEPKTATAPTKKRKDGKEGSKPAKMKKVKSAKA